jgi:hypothetical protein
MRVNSEGKKRVEREKKNNEEIPGGRTKVSLFSLGNLLKKGGAKNE